MRNIDVNTFTPQQKTIAVNNRFGNTGIKQQQGSTIILYDTLPLDGSTELRFFEGSAQRNFPLSNTGSDGNKLGVGNTMVIERYYLTEVTTDADTGAKTFQPILIGGISGVVLAEMTISVANTEVIKKVPVLSSLPQFNKIAENQLNHSFEFDTMVVIPPLLEYVCALRLDTYTADSTKSLRLTIEGSGSIVAPRNTF